MTPNYTVHIEVKILCPYCGEREAMPEESLCFDCQQKIKNESLPWVSSNAMIQDNKQLWLPGFRK